jgi:GH43 family beta-xylosidase
LDASSWNKSGKPIFSKTEGIYGPGHCSFTKHKSDHGDIDVMVYHANTVSGTGWCGRSVWLQPISWENGYPILGTPCIEVEL